MTSPKLILLFQEMSELTAPECTTNCRVPRSCCSPEYCQMALKRAAEEGIGLRPTDHPTLPLMGAFGCIAPPYLRPSCTLHTCAINSFGFKPNDRAWAERYFELRSQIEEEEWSAHSE